MNYAQLAELHSKYSPRLAVLAFPCNQFGGQEPGTSEEIKEFVKQYNVQFDMFEKVCTDARQIDNVFESVCVILTDETVQYLF